MPTSLFVVTAWFGFAENPAVGVAIAEHSSLTGPLFRVFIQSNVQRLPFLAHLEHESFQAGVPTKLLFFEASHETRDNLQESQLENCFLLRALMLAIPEVSMNPIIGSNKSRTFQTLLKDLWRRYSTN